MPQKREHFGGRMAVIFAMAGSAIGLGNLWRFPYMTGEHGGSAFVFAYIIATILISLPVFMSEIIIGRRSGVNASQAMSKLCPGNRFWKAAGILPILIPLFIASYYSVIGGWSLDYLARACTMEFVETPIDRVESIFGSFITSAWRPVIMHLLFMGLTVAIVACGVRAGIEKFSKYSIPVLFLLVVVLAIYAIGLPGAKAGVAYLFKPDLSQLNGRTVSYALGQSFYSMSLGMGILITYGSYVSKKENILASSVGTALSDLGFALLAGLAIMPAVFAAGIEPGSGPGLIFQSVPFIFAKMAAGYPVLSAVMSILFFLTVTIAALTSCISLIEVGVAFLIERTGLGREKASLVLFLVCGLAGVLCSLSFGPLAGVKMFGMSIFDFFDWCSSNILLFIMALLSVIFTGFVMNRSELHDEFTNGGSKKFNCRIFGIYHFLIRWVCPIALVYLFIANFIL